MSGTRARSTSFSMYKEPPFLLIMPSECSFIHMNLPNLECRTGIYKECRLGLRLPMFERVYREERSLMDGLMMRPVKHQALYYDDSFFGCLFG